MSFDGPHRTTPHLLIEIVGDTDRRVCVVKVDAGSLSVGFSERESWRTWLSALENRLRALED